jgi:lysophospholipase L1-like esterase
LETAPPKQPRTAFRKGGFSILFAALILGLLETALRVSLGPPPPPVKVYAGLEKQDTWFEEKNNKVQATYDFGMAIKAFPAESPTKRVAFVGGSTVHGGLDDPTAKIEFPHLTQKTTRAHAVNVGQPGLDSHDLARLIPQLLQWRFDAVVLYTGHNDFGNTYFLDRYSGLKGGLTAQTGAALEHFQVYVQLRRALRSWQGGRERIIGQEHDNIKPTLSPARRQAAKRYLAANIRRIAWHCKKANIPLLLVLPVHDKSRVAALKGVPLFADSEAVAAIRSVAVDLEIPLFDTHAELTSETGTSTLDPEFFIDVVHLSPQGHRALATQLAPVLKDLIEDESTAP